MSFLITLTFCQQFVPDEKSEALEQSSLDKMENVVFGIIHVSVSQTSSKNIF